MDSKEGICVKFSNANREETMRHILETTYDVIIIGGGLTGASILFDLQTRGIKTLLLEKSDFASAASESFDLLIYDKDTFQSLPKSKRNELHQLNSNLGSAFQFIPAVELMSHHSPVSEQVKRRFLPFLKKAPIEQPVTKLIIHDQLKKQLQSFGRITQTHIPFVDTTRLTIDLIKASVALGADVMNYQMVTDLYISAEVVKGVFVEDQIIGETHVVYGKKVINATGLESASWHNRYKDPSVAKLTLSPRRKYQWLMDHALWPIKVPLIIKGGVFSQTVTIIPREEGVLISMIRQGEDMLRTHMVFTEVQSHLSRLFEQEVLNPDRVVTLKTVREVVTHDVKQSFSFYNTRPNVLTAIGSPMSNYRRYAALIGDEIVKQFKKEAAILYEASTTKERAIVSEIIEDSHAELPRFSERECQLMTKYHLLPDRFEQYSQRVERLMIDYPIPKLLFIELLYTLENEGIYKGGDFLMRRLRLDVFRYTLHSEVVFQILRFLEYRLAWTREERSYYEREVKQFLEERNKLYEG